MQGCENEERKIQTSVVRPHSRERFHEKLDRLAKAFEEQGHMVSRGLLPGIRDEEIVQRCKWFPSPIPEEILSLYSWRGGQPIDAWNQEFPFWFRDCAFCSLESAERDYPHIVSGWGKYPADNFLITHAFPFAEFNGAWLVLPCKGHSHHPSLEKPVFSVQLGVEVWFYSIETMVDTCIEWVSNPLWNTERGIPYEEELKIWRTHNPGIFAGDT